MRVSFCIENTDSDLFMQGIAWVWVTECSNHFRSSRPQRLAKAKTRKVVEAPLLPRGSVEPARSCYDMIRPVSQCTSDHHQLRQKTASCTNGGVWCQVKGSLGLSQTAKLQRCVPGWSEWSRNELMIIPRIVMRPLASLSRTSSSPCPSTLLAGI